MRKHLRAVTLVTRNCMLHKTCVEDALAWQANLSVLQQPCETALRFWKGVATMIGGVVVFASGRAVSHFYFSTSENTVTPEAWRQREPTVMHRRSKVWGHRLVSTLNSIVASFVKYRSRTLCDHDECTEIGQDAPHEYGNILVLSENHFQSLIKSGWDNSKCAKYAKESKI